MSDADLRGSSGDEIVSRSRVVLDGDLSEERLLSLIRLGREEESLGYKRSYDFVGKRVTKDKLEMVADVVAMANTSGGYIVLGVDEDRSETTAAYQPIGIPQDHLEALDPDKLVPQVNAYLGVPVTLKLQRHYLDDYDGKCFALIYVEESPTARSSWGRTDSTKKTGVPYRCSRPVTSSSAAGRPPRGPTRTT